MGGKFGTDRVIYKVALQLITSVCVHNVRKNLVIMTQGVLLSCIFCALFASVGNKEIQAGAELCKAQVKLGKLTT